MRHSARGQAVSAAPRRDPLFAQALIARWSPVRGAAVCPRSGVAIGYTRHPARGQAVSAAPRRDPLFAQALVARWSPGARRGFSRDAITSC